MTSFEPAKHKVIQPFRNPSEYTCFLEGVKRTAELFGLKVDSRAWGGGIPIDLTLYTPEEKPAPVVTVEIDESRKTVVFHTDDKLVKKKTKKKVRGKSNARTQ